MEVSNWYYNKGNWTNKYIKVSSSCKQNIDELVDNISQIIAEAGDVYFTTLDFTYAYGRGRYNKLANRAIFSSRGQIGENTSIQERVSWAYLNGGGISKVNGNLLKEFPQANVSIDDLLIVTKGTKIKYNALTEKAH